MGFSCGIVGLPNVGKSTLFNALTQSSVPASNYPFCTVEPNVGVVPVPDPRLAKLAELAPREKVVPATVEFIDIAGLIQGSSHGEGLGNQFLSHILAVDAIVHVVRCFEDPQVAHVTGEINPKRDIEIVETELALKDLQVVSSNLEHLKKVAKSGDKKAQATVDALEKVKGALNQGTPARSVMKGFTPQEADLIAPYTLLTAKPVLFVANIAESDLGTPEVACLSGVSQIAAQEGAPVVPICAKLETEISQLESEEERTEYLKAVGLEEPSLNRFIRSGYEALTLITFFTLVGTKELRAWAIRRGSTALQAAGKIHSDMARGFIRAEVIHCDDFVALGSEAEARRHGKMRVEGKEYVVKDGDILHIRFNV